MTIAPRQGWYGLMAASSLTSATARVVARPRPPGSPAVVKDRRRFDLRRRREDSTGVRAQPGIGGTTWVVEDVDVAP
jgi:hypothetical protein